jgi:hypothetical protein
MSHDEIEIVVRKEDRVLLVMVAVLVTATVLKPWLLVWDLGVPLTIMAGLGAMRLVVWLRSVSLAASEPAE